MRLDRPLLKLPIRFDAEALKREVRTLPESAWVPHPTGFKGNEAVRLITVGGEATDDFKGEMRPTEYLLACPSIMHIMAELGAVWGRSRLMGLGAGGEVPRHVDSHYYWRTHWRIHIPVITNPDVNFTCGPETVHMQAGECWLFDSFRWHAVKNGGSEQRVHLVLDTVGGSRLWQLIESAEAGDSEPILVRRGAATVADLRFEKVNAPRVMSPWEIRTHFAFLTSRATPHPLLPQVLGRLDRFIDDWAVAWTEFGCDDAGVPTYVQLLESIKADLAAIGGGTILLENRLQLYLALDHMVFLNLLDVPGVAPAAAAPMDPVRLAS